MRETLFRLEYNPLTKEWVVVVRKPAPGGKGWLRVEERCYYTTDREDAIHTMEEMIKEDEQHDLV